MYEIIKVSDLDSVEKTADYLRAGRIVCAPTDTIYGLLADALNKETVERLYSIRRPSNRPFIILLPNIEWIYRFNPIIKPYHESLFSLGITLIVYPKSFFPNYLTRARRGLAFRIPPKDTFIGKVLSALDKPVVAPSANPEGEKPATNVQEAINYFGERIDLYVDGGKIEGEPSTIFKLIGYRGLRLVREGKVKGKEVLNFFKDVLAQTQKRKRF